MVGALYTHVEKKSMNEHGQAQADLCGESLQEHRRGYGCDHIGFGGAAWMLASQIQVHE